MEDKASSIRWQTTTINQLSYVSNLIFTLIVGSIAFEVNLAVRNEPIKLISCFSKSAFILSLIIFAISFIISILLFFNRLKDYRDTTEIARLREDSKNQDSSLPALRSENKKLGKKTWFLFNTQMITFSIAVVLAVISLSDLIIKNISSI